MPQGQTLAAMVRAKYPGAYDDLSDQQLETQVKTKFPGVYDDLPVSTAAAPSGGGMLDTAIETAKGFGKSLLSIPESLGKLPHMIPGVSQGIDALYGTPGLSQAAFQQADEDLKAKNTPQAVGKFAGDVATAFVPAGLVTKGAKAVASLAPRGLGIATRAGVEAAGAGGIAAAQGHDPTAAAVTGGLLGGASGMAGAAAAKLKRSADASMIAALGPAGRGTGPAGTNQVEMAKKVAPELLKRNFKPLSHEDALVNIGEAIDAASGQIDTIMTSLPKGTRVRTKPIIDALMTAKKQGQVRGVSVGTGKIANDVIDSVIKDLKGIGPSMTPEEAVKFRQRIGPLAKWSNLVGPAENVRAEAHKDVYNGIRSAIESLDPGIRGANKEMSFWLNVRDLIERSSRRPQPPSSGTSGAIIGAVTGQAGGPWGALGAAAVGRQLQRLTRSPGWRFVSANIKDDMANALMTRDMGRFNQLVAVAASQLGGE